MSTFYDRIPNYRKFGRFLWKSFLGLFTWSRLRRLLLACAVLITLVAIFYAEEDWRGQRNWEAYKAKQKQDGIPFTREEMQPPSVPDDQNFAMTPSLVSDREGDQQQLNDELERKVSWSVLGPNVDVRDDLLGMIMNKGSIDLNALAKPLTGPELIEAMKRYDAVLDEFTAASKRPSAKFSENFPLRGVFQLVMVFQMRASIELVDGRPDQAKDDVVTMFRIARHLTAGVTLTDQLISCADTIIGAAVLQYGLFQHLWTNDQLAAMQSALDQVDYVAALHRGFLALQVGLNERKNIVELTWGGLPQRGYRGRPGMVQLMSDVLPSGWVDQNLLNYNENYSELVSAIKVSEHRFDVEGLAQVEAKYRHQGLTPYNFLAHANQAAMFRILQGGAMDVERIDLARVACALERYRLANSALPEKLEDLTPQYMTKIPMNVITGGHLHYQRQADGHYLLYAVGWDGKEGSSQVPGKTDVIWQDVPDSK